MTPSGKVKLFIFQFHYGSVKSVGALEAKLLWCYFNSTMVRLKEEPAIYLKTEIEEFQFHYGSVKSLFVSICP